MWSLHTFKILIVREFGHAKEQSKRQIMMSSWIQSLIILIHQLKMFSSLDSLESLCQLWNFEGENDTNITETNMRFWQKCEVSSSSSFFFFSFFFFLIFLCTWGFFICQLKWKRKRKKRHAKYNGPIDVCPNRIDYHQEEFLPLSVLLMFLFTKSNKLRDHRNKYEIL